MLGLSSISIPAGMRFLCIYYIYRPGVVCIETWDMLCISMCACDILPDSRYNAACATQQIRSFWPLKRGNTCYQHLFFFHKPWAAQCLCCWEAPDIPPLLKWCSPTDSLAPRHTQFLSFCTETGCSSLETEIVVPYCSTPTKVIIVFSNITYNII